MTVETQSARVTNAYPIATGLFPAWGFITSLVNPLVAAVKGVLHLKRNCLMRSIWFAALCALAIGASSPAPAQAEGPEPNTTIEIYRIAPGQHEAFLKEIARYDEANRLAGVPPRQLYVHSDGADWDFILVQPAHYPPDKQAALDKAWKELGLPSGADFFLNFRRFIAEHSDTVAIGPTTAANYLATRNAK